jgi:hypothetical protein
MEQLEPERPDQVRALSRLAAAELGDGAGGIGSIHEAIARRVFDSLGPRAAPARVAHDGRRRGSSSSCTA